MKSLREIDVIPEGGQETVSGRCEHHGEFTVKALWIFGDLRNAEPQCPKCFEQEKVEAEQKEQDELELRRQKARERKLIDAGIPLRILEAEKYDPPTERAKQNLQVMKDYLEEFDANYQSGSSMIFCGKPGTGKTHLACKFGVALLDQGYSVQYATMNKALRAIRATYGKESERTEQQVINLLTNPDMLILDELGVKSASDYDKTMMFEVIDERYQSKLPTLVISNLSVSKLKEATDERMMDRLQHSGTVLVFDWESYRGAS